VFTAVEQMFSLNPDDVLKSRATWAGVRAVEENGIFSAWQAYQAVFLADPGHMYDYRLTLEECRENMRRALAEEPFNGLVLSLCAHVEAFLFRDFSAAWDLIDRAGLTGTRHVMYYDALSLLRFYTGRYDQARESANMALSAGRHLSFSYAFATTLCMIEGMAGRYDAAISHGRRALQLEPADRKMSYPPVLRYLGAALAHRGEVDEARTLFGQLPESGRLPSSIGAPGDALPAEAAAEFVRSALVLSRT
jgi:tetratricopeptide (TPR) repeat protein